MVREAADLQPAQDLRATAVVLAARGRTNVAIAKALGVNEHTVAKWRQETTWTDAYNAELDRIRASLDAAIAPLIPKALGRYERVLDEGEDTHAVIVAKDLLDRQFGRAVQREERQTRADNRVGEANLDWDANILAQLQAEDPALVKGLWTEGELAEVLRGAGTEVQDPNAEWKDMPEFEQEDETAFCSIVVHFKNQDALDGFAKLVNQKLTARTRAIWIPQAEIKTYADKRYVDET